MVDFPAKTCFGGSGVGNTKVVVTEDVLAVTSVSAVNATTLTVIGTKLGDLTATDVTVAGNTVSSYTAAEDGKSATIVLGTALVPDSTTDVTINGTTFTVKYEATKASAVELTTTTFDNNTANQQMKLKVNGADMSISELIANGYEVKFYAYETMSTSSTSKTSVVFQNTGSGYSNDGVINNNITTLGSYYVKAVIVKNGEALESAVTEIQILDLDTQTTGVNNVTFTDNAAKFIANSTGTLSLVQGETVNITNLNITNGGKKYDVVPASATTALKSSNTSVLTITDYDTIVARAAGTSTLTVTYGQHSIAISVTIDKTGRWLSSVKADGGNTAKIVNGETALLKFFAVDNHGAVMTDAANIGLYAEVTSNGYALDLGSTSPVTAGTKSCVSAVDPADGHVKVYVNATAANASATISLFQSNTGATAKAAGASSKLNVSVSTVAATNTTFGLVNTTINAPKYVQDGSISTLDLNTLNARSQALVLQGSTYKNGVASVAVPTFGTMATTPKIYFNDSVVEIRESAVKPSSYTTGGTTLSNGASLTSTNTYLDVHAKNAGTTTIRVNDGDITVATYTITVVNTTPSVASITPKTATFGNTDTSMNVTDIFDMSGVTGTTFEVKGVTYAANSTSLKVMYTTAAIGSYVLADHFYIYNAGAKDAEATYLDLGGLIGVVTSGTVTSLGSSAASITTSGTSIVPADAGTVNLYLSADTSFDAGDSLIATITVQ